MPSPKLNAIQLLTADHRTVEDLFEKFEDTDSVSEQRRIAKAICQELTVHTMIEEEIFYPALRGSADDDLLDEAYVEHDGAKMLVRDLIANDADDEYFKAKVTVLKEQIEHHVKEEEKSRDGLFAQAKKSDLDLDVIGAEMAVRKKELMAQAKNGSLPEPEYATVLSE